MANCDRKACHGQGTWRPVLLVTTKGYSGPPAKSVVGLRICDDCRKKMTVADLVTDDGWTSICAAFTLRGFARPTRKLTKLDWERIN
jgi:hypothetical protein